MPEEFDGSVLDTEQQDQSPTNQAPQGKEPVTPIGNVKTQTDSGDSTPKQPESKPSYEVPDQYKDYTPEDWHKLYRDTKAEEGRRLKEAERILQENLALKNRMSSYNPNASNNSSFDVNKQPSPSPSSEAQGQTGQLSKEQLAQLLEDDTVSALEYISRQAAKQGSAETLAEYEQRVKQNQEVAAARRRQAITDQAGAAIFKLRNEDPRLTDYVLSEMYKIDDTDETSAALENDPNLTPAKIESHVKYLFEKALEGITSNKEATLRQLGYDDEALRQYKAFEKQAAANGAPTPKAGQGPAGLPQQGGQIPQSVKHWSFLDSVKAKYGVE